MEWHSLFLRQDFTPYSKDNFSRDGDDETPAIYMEVRTSESQSEATSWAFVEGKLDVSLC